MRGLVTIVSWRIRLLLAVFALIGLLAGCNGSNSNNSDQAPTISLPAAQTVVQGQPLAFQVDGSDPGGGTLTFSATGAPDHASLDASTGEFTWTPTFDEIGIHVLTFMVSNGQKSTSGQVSVTVTPDQAQDESEPLAGGTIDPLTIPKYVTPLVIPPVMHNTGEADNYSIAVRQFQQQILPGGIWNTLNGRADAFPATTVWSYGPQSDPAPDSTAVGGGAGIAPAPNSQFNYPSYTIETRADQQVKVRWINDLVDGDGNYLPHLFSVDPTLHGANPPADLPRRTNRHRLRRARPHPLYGAGTHRHPRARGPRRQPQRRLPRSLVAAGGRQYPRRVCPLRHAL